MTLDAIKLVQESYKAEKLFYISTTCLKSVYISQTKGLKFDDVAEVVEWEDKFHNLTYRLDYADINMSVDYTDKDGTSAPMIQY